ncbi:MAG: ImmA/IrrE family metallo-endopeptidase [Pirellulales bacterium]
MFAEIPADQLADALDACAAEILWEASVTEPPVDAALIAERLGLVIAHNPALACRGRLVELADPRGGVATQGTIVVGPAERPERLQWAVAHEIGESVAYRVFGALGIRGEDAAENARECVANHLASCLLLPRDWFAADGDRLDWDLFALKQRYATASHELIARRMLEMNVPIVVTLFDQGRVRWRRSNSGGRPPELTCEESQAWKSAHEMGTRCRLDCDPEKSGLESTTAWPVHEPDWKREIVRSCVVEW